MDQGIRTDSFVNVALVYGYYGGGQATQGVQTAKSAYSLVISGCSTIDACRNLEPLRSGRTETREARFIGTQGVPREGYIVRSGEFFVEMFVVCPDKCKG